jgi:hypothetical protein
MMMKGRLQAEAALRFAERRQREDDAPRLRERVPTLATLRLEVTDGRGGAAEGPRHARIVVVETAPALFSLTCGDHACRGGGHDLTSSVMRGLLAGVTRFDVEDTCAGSLGGAGCDRTVRVQVTATYR